MEFEMKFELIKEKEFKTEKGVFNYLNKKFIGDFEDLDLSYFLYYEEEEMILVRVFYENNKYYVEEYKVQVYLDFNEVFKKFSYLEEEGVII